VTSDKIKIDIFLASGFSIKILISFKKKTTISEA
jgi:hypothetical protein